MDEVEKQARAFRAFYNRGHAHAAHHVFLRWARQEGISVSDRGVVWGRYVEIEKADPSPSPLQRRMTRDAE